MSAPLTGKIHISGLKPGSSEWHNEYFNNVRPSVTEALGQKIKNEQSAGRIPYYDNLVLILGHNANPALIISQAISSGRIILLFTEKHRKQLNQLYLPAMNIEMSGVPIEFLELDYTDHDSNYKIIRDALGSIDKNLKTLCDITGGKKITSTQLGMAANRAGMDICYIDTSDLLKNSPVPEPGSESIYIQCSGRDAVHEISLKTEDLLVINRAGESTINYNLSIAGNFFNYQNNSITSTLRDTIRNNIEVEYCRIDHAIRSNTGCTDVIDDISGIVRSMLIATDLDEVLRRFNSGRLKLVVDPVLAGIPWEAVLEREYGFNGPIPGRMMRDNMHCFTRSEEKNGILFIKGSGESIGGFAEAAESIENLIKQSREKYNTVEAADAGVVSRELSRRRYNIVIYYGHSEFNEDPATTGWRCINGEIFNCEQFAVLRHNPPDMILSNSCNSARAIPFLSHSIACQALRYGTKSFIGTRFLLEFSRSNLFISSLVRNLLHEKLSPEESFTGAVSLLKNNFGENDVSAYSYVFYH